VRCIDCLVRENREGVFINSEYLVLKDLDSLLSIDILGDREQVCIVSKAIKNHENEVAFLVAR
jgi:hypothetical protein